MTKSIFFYASLALNALLVLTIVNIYQSDLYFRAWVQQSIGPQYPILVLTLAIGGGSGLGYLLLQRKRPTRGISSTVRLGKSGIPKPSVLTNSQASPTLQARSPTHSSQTTGTQMPRQVAYAVPPPAPSKPGSQKSVPSTVTWSQPSKSTSPLSQPQSSPGLSLKEPSGLGPSSSIPSAPVRNQQIPWQPAGQTPSNQQSIDRKGPEQSPQGVRPGFDLPKVSPSFPSGSSSTGTQPQPSTTLPSSPAPFPSKWAAPNQPPSPSGIPQRLQSIGPSPQSRDFDPSQKWAPVKPYSQDPVPPTVLTAPSGIGPQPRPNQGSPPFPGPGASPQKPQIGPGGPQPQQQMRPFPPPGNTFTARPMPGQIPRPFPPPSPGQQGIGPTNRPSELGPIGVPRPPMPSQQAPPRPLAPPPQQWKGPPLPRTSSISDSQKTEVSSKPEQPKIGQTKPAQTSGQKEQDASGTGSSSTPSSENSVLPGASDMDWDTALDTILKTLRRDRIRDEQ